VSSVSLRLSCFVLRFLLLMDMIFLTYNSKSYLTLKARNKKYPVDVFLISLHFAEELATVKSDFGEQFD
jgi:hypothetical protein